MLVCFGGAGRATRQLSLTLRVDLASAEHDCSVAATLGRHVGRVDPPPSAAMVFVVSADADDVVPAIRVDPWQVAVPRPDAPARPGVPDLPRRALVQACVEELADTGVATVDALLLRGGRWWSYPDVDRLTGAGQGTPLDPAGSRLTGAAALSGRAVEPDRAAVLARAWPATAPTGLVEAACDRADEEVAQRFRRVGAPTAVDECWATVLAAVGAYAPGSRDAITADAVARVGTALSLVPVRDRALALSSTDDDDLLAAAESLWTDLNARLPADLAAVPALLLGYTAWLRGSGALAVAALERSVACHPTSMARMLLQAVQGALPPDALRAAMSSPADDEVAGPGLSGGSRPSPRRRGTPGGWPG